MVGGYQIIDLKDCISPASGTYASKKIIGINKPIILKCNGINNIYSFNSWNYAGYVDLDGQGTMGYIYSGTFYDGEDEISVEIDIVDVPQEGPGFLYNTMIRIAGGSD